MFHFSVNYLFQLRRRNTPSVRCFLLRDLDTRRVCRLHDFTKTLLLRPGVAYSVADKATAPISFTWCSNRSDGPTTRGLSLLLFLLTARDVGGISPA